MKRIRSVSLLLGLASVLVANCDTGHSTASLAIDADNASTLDLSTPPFILQVRDIDPAEVTLEVLVNGSVIDMQRQNEQWTGSVLVPIGDIVSIALTWSENASGGSEALVLGTYSDTIGPITTEMSLPLSTDDYSTVNHDQDGDGLSNLHERLNGSNPLDAQDPQALLDPVVAADTIGIDVSVLEAPRENPDIDVFIPRIDPSESPLIDGEYDNVWDRAVFTDYNGEVLAIDNFIWGRDNSRADGATEFQWLALHDGTYLYLYVMGEQVENATLVADSDFVWNDDNIELFLDGDNSKGSSYDGINDYQLFIPHLKLKDPLEANNSNDTDSRRHVGSDPFRSDPWPTDIAFATCLCATDRHAWEIRVGLEQIDITVGQPFGIDLQYSDDHDGGRRNAKWGWKLVNPDMIDDAWNNPSVLGTAILQ